jgi:hypothetical protein
MTAPRDSNIFAATCTRCGLLVPPGKGLCAGRIGKNWQVFHYDTCIPKIEVPDARPWVKELEYDL